MKHHLATIGILALALALYAIGLERGAIGVVIAGAGFELWFWVRLFPGFGILRRDPSRSPKDRA